MGGSASGRRRQRSSRRKIVAAARLATVLRSLQRRGHRVVFTNGCFDLLHPGHVRYLRDAKALGDLLVVALNSDASVRRLKGSGKPVVPLADRCEVVAALEMVDYVTTFSSDTPYELIRRLQPDVLVKGVTGPRSVSSAPTSSSAAVESCARCRSRPATPPRACSTASPARGRGPLGQPPRLHRPGTPPLRPIGRCDS